MNRLFGAVMTALATCTAPVLADADTAAPAAEPTEAYRFIYSGRVLGLRVMKASVDIAFTPDSYTGVARFRSAGLAGFFSASTVTASGSGAVTEDGLAPTTYEHVEDLPNKTRTVTFAFTPEDVVVTADPPLGGLGDPPATAEQKRAAIDPFSMVAALMSPQAGETACTRTVPVFDSKLRYDLAITPVKPDRIRTRAWRGTAEKCRVRYVPIAGYDAEDKDNQDAYDTPVSLWLAPLTESRYVPARIAATFDAGPVTVPVRLNLTRLERKTGE